MQDQSASMKPNEGTTFSPKAVPPTPPHRRPSLLRSVFSISSLQHHISPFGDAEIPPTKLKPASAPSTPISATPPPKRDITAPKKMSEAGTGYFMPGLASPTSTSERGLVPFTITPKTRGIDWRYGAQGLSLSPGTSLLVNAAEESRRSVNSTFSSNFERSTYITGLQNLLNGLPLDLRESEITILQHAVPPAVVTRIIQESSPTEHNKPEVKHKDVYRENVLHKFLLWIFCLVDRWVWFVWPKLLCFYVRMKQVSQDHGQEVAGSLGRGALSVASAIVFVVNQEPVMEAARGIGKWVYEGVSGAVTDFVAMKVAERSEGSNKKKKEEKEEEKEGEEEVKLKASWWERYLW
ncbi:uncharacterized protein B0T23DRAFT_213244 [Neurospora hispaniola]|uniref:Uncharacterized protein n=1 Tax=Neurospora hispaniola TaxID=588809 RepID=A0AAJ0I1R9_9PEZI|nr:hypothetical protein B0T23DRAFT_213244 [Neurospora hispaniola]